MSLNVLIEVLKEKHLQVFSDPKSAFFVQRLEEYEGRFRRRRKTTA